MIFATDLDNTMIFSHRKVAGKENQFCCVEYYNGKPISYMTPTAIQKLEYLMKNIYVIPTTTRSISQFKRIEFFSNAEYSIADNGGTILHNGCIYPEWDTYISNILKDYDFEKTYNLFTKLPSLISTPRIVDGKFVFAKSDDITDCKKFLESELNTKMWQLSFQGKKVYAIPSVITKGNALKYLAEHLIADNHPIISAGDSNLDVSMLEYSNYGLIPSDCNLAALNNTGFIKTGTGIYSTDSILDFVINLFQN